MKQYLNRHFVHAFKKIMQSYDQFNTQYWSASNFSINKCIHVTSKTAHCSEDKGKKCTLFTT